MIQLSFILHLSRMRGTTPQAAVYFGVHDERGDILCFVVAEYASVTQVRVYGTHSLRLRKGWQAGYDCKSPGLRDLVADARRQLSRVDPASVRRAALIADRTRPFQLEVTP